MVNGRVDRRVRGRVLARLADYKELEVWQATIRLAVATDKFAKRLPDEEEFGPVRQRWLIAYPKTYPG